MLMKLLNPCIESVDALNTQEITPPGVLYCRRQCAPSTNISTDESCSCTYIYENFLGQPVAGDRHGTHFTAPVLRRAGTREAKGNTCFSLQESFALADSCHVTGYRTCLRGVTLDEECVGANDEPRRPAETLPKPCVMTLGLLGT